MFFNRKKKDDVSLSNAEILMLQEKSKNIQLHFAQTSKLSDENMAGDLQSRTHGTGIDFEENQPYFPGNDSRHINWRTYARTRQLYINIYNEDKRPSLYVVMDQRRDMYFSTRKQLKIKLALKLAFYNIFHAVYQQYTVSGMQIKTVPQWHTVYSGQSSVLSFIKELNRPKRNITAANTEPALNDILSRLQLKEGAELVIISDFHDMNDNTINLLYHFSMKNKISLIQVLDPIELALPTSGNFRITGDTDSEVLQLDCNNKRITERYNNISTETFSRYQSQCQNMGIKFTRYLTTDDIEYE